MDALQATDNAAASNAVAPRVSLADIEASIAAKYFLTAEEALTGVGFVVPANSPLRLLTICILEMNNGFVIVGKSAPASPASPENFYPKLGEKFAYEDAVRQLWPLMGYALRERLHNS